MELGLYVYSKLPLMNTQTDQQQAEKLSDLATCAAQQVNVNSPVQEYPIHADLGKPDLNGTQPHQDSPTSTSSSRSVNNGAEEMLNGYLSLFASFRRGRHPFLKPYMRLLLLRD
jgi:hypothetical protein